MMPEQMDEHEGSVADDTLLPAQGVDSDISDLGDALGHEVLDGGARESPATEALEELNLLEKKIEELIAYCAKLTLVNRNLSEQLAKERESKARIQEVNSSARQRIQQLIQRLRDLEEAER